ncbi:hypothetical protein [Nocardioides sp. InS609-2]|uniref:hypothetical protein n=1 Tax=Nocardioides sp. InS609-2 TaxID=2760705 RepID=UPI0020BE5DC8|nr:hypothetical protein [Nocardioides sp. InS609-2]
MTQRVGLVVAALVLFATGCGDEGDVSGTDKSAAWRTSTDPVTTSGLAWAAGSTVHLSDGTQIDTGGFVRSFVVAGDGVFFVPADSEEDAGLADFPVEELKFGLPGESPTGTGLTLSGWLLAGSPDGRYLAAIDTTSGEKDDFGTPQATVLAFDLQTGERVIDSTLGMGDPDEDDFADGYSEVELQILSMTNESVSVGAFGNFVFDLTTGEGRELEEGEGGPTVDDELTSPSGEWRIENPEEGSDRIVGADGRKVALDPGTPRWLVSWWADDETAVGAVISGPGAGNRVEPGDTAALMTCVVPSGECQVFEDSAGQKVVFPDAFNGPDAITLPRGGAA